MISGIVRHNPYFFFYTSFFIYFPKGRANTWPFIVQVIMMADLIIGTTPTIKYDFNTVDVSDIVTAILSIKSEGSIVVQKSLEEAAVSEASLSWTLTQQETLSFKPNQKARMMLNYKLSDGTRGASSETEINIRTNHITEVI